MPEEEEEVQQLSRELDDEEKKEGKHLAKLEGELGELRKLESSLKGIKPDSIVV